MSIVIAILMVAIPTLISLPLILILTYIAANKRDAVAYRKTVKRFSTLLNQKDDEIERLQVTINELTKDS